MPSFDPPLIPNLKFVGLPSLCQALGLGSTALQLRIKAWRAVTASATYGNERSTPVDDCCVVQRSRRISQAIAYFVKEAI